MDGIDCSLSGTFAMIDEIKSFNRMNLTTKTMRYVYEIKVDVYGV